MQLFAANLLEAAPPTPAPSSAGEVARLTDRETGPQYVGAVGAITIDTDLGAAGPAVTGWAALHHNLAGVTVSLYSGASFPPATLRDSLDPAGADLLRTFAAVTARYWRWAIPALSGSVAPLLGELLLGVPLTVTDKPSLPSGWPATIGNVARDRSPSGFPWATRRGPSRSRLELDWQGLPQADLLALQTAFAQCQEGARPLLLQDAAGVLRWVTWTDPELAPEALGSGLFHVRASFETLPE